MKRNKRSFGERVFYTCGIILALEMACPDESKGVLSAVFGLSNDVRPLLEFSQKCGVLVCSIFRSKKLYAADITTLVNGLWG